MYSSAFTLQTGAIKEVLDEAKAGEGEDWALAWTVEELESEVMETHFENLTSYKNRNGGLWGLV